MVTFDDEYRGYKTLCELHEQTPFACVAVIAGRNAASLHAVPPLIPLFVHFAGAANCSKLASHLTRFA